MGELVRRRCIIFLILSTATLFSRNILAQENNGPSCSKKAHTLNIEGFSNAKITFNVTIPKFCIEDNWIRNVEIPGDYYSRYCNSNYSRQPIGSEYFYRITCNLPDFFPSIDCENSHISSIHLISSGSRDKLTELCEKFKKSNSQTAAKSKCEVSDIKFTETFGCYDDIENNCIAKGTYVSYSCIPNLAELKSIGCKVGNGTFSCPISTGLSPSGASCGGNTLSIGSLRISDFASNDPKKLNVCDTLRVARNPPPKIPDKPGNTNTVDIVDYKDCSDGYRIPDSITDAEYEAMTADQKRNACVPNVAPGNSVVTVTGVNNQPIQGTPQVFQCAQQIGQTAGLGCLGVDDTEFEVFVQKCRELDSSLSLQNCYSQQCNEYGSKISIDACVSKISAAIQHKEEQQVAGSYTSPDISACTERQDEASDCCENPLKCAFGIDALGTASSNQLDRIVTQAVGNATVGAGQTAQCKFIKNANAVMAAMHSSMASQCGKKVNSCKQVCKTMITHVESEMTRLSCKKTGISNSRTMTLSVSSNPIDAICNRAQEDLNQLRAPTEICNDTLNEALGQLGMQLAQNVSDMAAANSCEDLSKQNAGPVDKFDPNSLMPNCSDPANASHPFCMFNSTSGSQGVAARAASAGGGFDSTANIGGAGAGEGEQGVIIPETAIKANESAGIGGGGSGSSGLGSSGGSGGGSSQAGSGGASGGGGSSGLNTNIANATARSGWTQSSSDSGGSGGYSSSRKRDKDSGGGLDFKKMLGMLNKNKASGSRSIAGFGAAKKAQDVDKAYGDIFKKISDTWFKNCETDTYDDCKGNMRQGN